jgi:acyl carrier protein
MTMMTLSERIQKLSPQQQDRLWERLGHDSAHKQTAPDADGDGAKQLVAYVVLRPGQSVPETELKEFLRPAMLEVMVPSQFVFLDALPLAPGGKVDRSALPVPDTGPVAAAAFVGPQSDAEVALAKIWADVLHVPSVGAHDNFFELGGHSLLALQMMGRIRETFKADLPLRTLFDFPTVAGLAAAIDKAPRSGAAGPIKKIPRTDVLEHTRFSSPTQ